MVIYHVLQMFWISINVFLKTYFSGVGVFFSWIIDKTCNRVTVYVLLHEYANKSFIIQLST